MPLYNYYCPKCGFEKEEIHKMTESPEIICDKCKTKMKIGLQPTAFKIGGYFTSKSGYAKSKKYKEAVNKKKKMENSDKKQTIKIRK